MNKLIPLLTSGCVLLTLSSPASGAPAKKAPKSRPAPAASPSIQAAAVLSRLKADEEKLKSARLTLHSVRRLGEIPAKATEAAARAAVKKAPVAAQRREYLIFSGPDWRRDITVTDAHGDVSVSFRLGVTEGVGRILQEPGGINAGPRTGSVGAAPQQEPADRILMGRSSELIQDLTWKSVTRAKDRITLAGVKGSDRVSLTIRTVPRYAVERLARSGHVSTQEGRVPGTQVFTAVYERTPGGLALKSLEDLMYIGGPVNRGSITTSRVEGAQINPAVRPDELAIAFPAGARMSDARFTPPVRYVQGDTDLTLDDLTALHEKKRSAAAQVGRPAPDAELKTLEGKAARLADNRGKVVLLTWFASW